MASSPAAQLLALPYGKIQPQSVVITQGIECGIARIEGDLRLAVLGPAASLSGLEGITSEYAGQMLLTGPMNAANMIRLRTLFPWLIPHPLGLSTSAGLGDRLGLATPGHVRAVRAFHGEIEPIFAQQSIREMTRTNRTPQQVMDDAAWGVFAEGWHEGFGADADHLKTPVDIDRCVAAGYTFYTVDPGEYVDNRAETLAADGLRTAFEALPWDKLDDTAAALRRRYVDKSVDLENGKITFDEQALLKAGVKYGRVIAHVLMMYRHLVEVAKSQPWELEISVDETELPTSHAEHVYIVGELQRLGIKWVSLAPRFIGRFEKGVDYIGDLKAFEDDFAVHAMIARRYGPYKLSLHSGSDKFSVYEIAARQTKGVVHLKTAGTSYLEALHTIAQVDPAFFRAIYDFGREHYEADSATYHVSARLDRAPLSANVADADLPALLDQFDARQIFHVTFGSVLRAKAGDGKPLFYDHFMQLLRANSDLYASNLEAHFRRHLAPFAGQKS